MYKRQLPLEAKKVARAGLITPHQFERRRAPHHPVVSAVAVSYTHLRAHEIVLDLVCRLLLEKKKEVSHFLHLPPLT